MPVTRPTAPIRAIVVLAVMLILAAGIFGVWRVTTSTYDGATVVINSHALSVELFDTPEEQARGLSGRSKLSQGSGALFVYSENGNHSIWMKDMYFAIDVLWISEEGRVVDAVDDMTPDTYPKTFTSSGPARYVLELPSSAIGDYGISIGTEVDNLPTSR